MLTHSLTQETDKWISFVQTPVVLLSKNCSSWLVTVMLERNWWTLINTFSVNMLTCKLLSHYNTNRYISDTIKWSGISQCDMYNISTTTLNLICSVELTTTEVWWGRRRWHGDVMKKCYVIKSLSRVTVSVWLLCNEQLWTGSWSLAVLCFLGERVWRRSRHTVAAISRSTPGGYCRHSLHIRWANCDLRTMRPVLSCVLLFNLCASCCFLLSVFLCVRLPEKKNWKITYQ